MKKLNKQQFVERSEEVHGKKYDYSLVEYVNNHEKICIICKTCKSVFKKTPMKHLAGEGCQICKPNLYKKITTEEFIKKAKEIHNNKYKYSETNYINAKTKVKITCVKHGNFEQIPDNHITKEYGCPLCANERKKNTIEYFIEKSIKIHGEKYNYSLVKYINNYTKVTIKCNMCHNIFEQTPNTHVDTKSGCPFCAKVKKLSIENFIERAREIHGDKYDYSMVEYINLKTKVKIICKEHDFVFKQMPRCHLHEKQGCPKCGNTKRRISAIKIVERNKFNGNQISPAYNPVACKMFDNISKNKNIHIQHAMNGGEYYIKELGYWVDGYDKDNNVVYEYDEKYHFKDGKLKIKNIERQLEIEHLLKCQFIRIKYDDTMNEKDG